jgi:hypothetical protein
MRMDKYLEAHIIIVVVGDVPCLFVAVCLARAFILFYFIHPKGKKHTLIIVVLDSHVRVARVFRIVAVAIVVVRADLS